MKIPKRILLIGKEKLGEEKMQKVGKLLDKYPIISTPNGNPFIVAWLACLTHKVQAKQNITESKSSTQVFSKGT